MASLTAFKGKIGYGVRPNLFMVSIADLETAPAAIAGNGDAKGQPFKFLCRSAGLPAASVGTVEVPFRGRVIKLPGDRTFESWTVTVMLDEDFTIRAFFEKWLDSLNRHSDGAGHTSKFASTLQVEQLKRNTTTGDGDKQPFNTVLRKYQFMNAFPTNVSQIDLSYDNNNSISEYTVEFQYDWWESSGGTATANIGASSGI
tara:strand:+ start:686 stop:1288 length:603 start_codon:yes stop_codon:yes gene_type:complete